MFTASFPAMDTVLPSRRQVKKDMRMMHDRTSSNLKARLRETHSAIHISLDGWTDRSGKAYIAIIANWSFSQEKMVGTDSQFKAMQAMLSFH